jgi:hypothetical protein
MSIVLSSAYGDAIWRVKEVIEKYFSGPKNRQLYGKTWKAGLKKHPPIMTQSLMVYLASLALPKRYRTFTTNL